MSEESEVVEVEPADDKSPAPEAEAKPDIVQTELNAIGLGDDSAKPEQEDSHAGNEQDVTEPVETAPLSQHDAAARKYRRAAAENAAAKEARKDE